jgi:hypothetical protein
MRARAVEDHRIPERAPLQVAVGERVSVGERDTEWPAFVFVTGTQGEGWVPRRHLSGDSGEATVLVAYDTTELPVDVGDEVEVIERDDPSGWWWCRNAAGEEGWVPVAALELM